MTVRISSWAALLFTLTAFGPTNLAADDAACMKCHDKALWAPPSDPRIPQLHNPAGGYFEEAHETWSCVDCHEGLEKYPHNKELVARGVDCLLCHEDVPVNEAD